LLPAAEIIASTTTIAARLIGWEGRLGIVAPGALADLIVVDGNPLDDVSILAHPDRNIPLVMQGGRIHRQSLP